MTTRCWTLTQCGPILYMKDGSRFVFICSLTILLFCCCICFLKVKYLPTGWLVFYYKPSNGFHYMSDLGKFFNSAKRVIDFLKKNNYNPQIAKDVKTNMAESKKFTGAIKYKWLPGDETLPKGWKRRTTKGSSKTLDTGRGGNKPLVIRTTTIGGGDFY